MLMRAGFYICSSPERCGFEIGGAFSRLFEIIPLLLALIAEVSFTQTNSSPHSLHRGQLLRIGLVEVKLHHSHASMSLPMSLPAVSLLGIRRRWAFGSAHIATITEDTAVVTGAVSSGGEAADGSTNGRLSRSIAQSITSSFLASATIAIFFLAAMPPLTRATKPFAQPQRRYTIHATSTSMLRNKLGPRRVIRPERFTVPLSICLGTSPA